MSEKDLGLNRDVLILLNGGRLDLSEKDMTACRVRDASLDIVIKDDGREWRNLPVSVRTNVGMSFLLQSYSTFSAHL